MNSMVPAIVIAFVAGIVGGYFGQSLSSGRGAGGEDLSDTDVSALREEIALLRQEVRRLRNPPETLSATGALPGSADGASADGLLEAAGGDAALVAHIDRRVEAAVQRRLAEMEEAASKQGAGRRGKKRLALADAAAELELSAREEDELRRIYEESQGKIFALLAEPDGDAEEIKREILAAVGTPGGGERVMAKYMPKLFTKIGDFMTMQADRKAAIVKAVGPEKARRLERDYSIREDDLLGLDGEMSVGVEARTEGR